MLTTLLFASLIALGPERLPSEPRFAAPAVSDIAVASNGRETLVAMSTGQGVFVQRLDGNAQPQTPHGTPLVRGAERLGGVAASQAGYVVFWTAQRAAWSTYISPTGDVSPPQLIAATDNAILWPKIASNGSDFLAVWSDSTAYTEQAMAARLDSQGRRIGNPFPLTERRQNASINAIASDGHDYLVAVEHFVGGDVFRSVLVPVSAIGAIGTGIDAPSLVRDLLHTADGYVALWFEQAPGPVPPMAYAAAVDASGHVGVPVLIDDELFESAASNGADIMVITSKTYSQRTFIRIRRFGGSIEVVQEATNRFSKMGVTHAGALHTGDYFAVSQSPLVFSVIKPAPVQDNEFVEQALLTFAVPQQFPAVAGKVVAWREGSSAAEWPPTTELRAALDSKSYHIASSVGAHAVASNAQRALIVWTELQPAGEAGAPTPLYLKGRTLATDGTLSPPFSIATAEQGIFTTDRIDLAAAIATASGFVVAWSQNSGARRALLDANGTLLSATALDFSGAFEMALAPRRDGFLVLARDRNGGTLAAAPFHADGRPAGPQRAVAASGVAVDLAGDGNGHFLAVWTGDTGLWSQPLDENGAPAGAPRFLGGKVRGRVTWTGSAFLLVSQSDIALLDSDGRLLEPLTPRLPDDANNTVADGNTIAYVHNATSTGAGDSYVVFERRIIPTRRRPASR